MEVAGIVIDFSKLPWPLLIVAVITVFSAVWYLTVYLGLVQEYDKLKNEQTESIQVLTATIGIVSNRLENIENITSLNGNVGVKLLEIETKLLALNGLNAKLVEIENKLNNCPNNINCIKTDLKEEIKDVENLINTVTNSLNNISMNINENHRLVEDKIDSGNENLSREIRLIDRLFGNGRNTNS